MHALLWLLLPVVMQLQPAKPVNAKLVVNWWTAHELKALAQAVPECGKEKEVDAPFAVTLSVCPGRDPAVSVPIAMMGKCEVRETRTLSLDDRAGSLTFENVPRGLHVLRITAGGLPPLLKQVRVYGDEVEEQHVELRWLTLYGKVTKQGKPVHARVFKTAVTDPETGRYTAALTHLPGKSSAAVAPCDGSPWYWFVPEEPPVENAAFDIDIPVNRVDVDVVDAATGQPIKDAAVQYAAPKEEHSTAAHFAMTGGRSDERGRVGIGPLAANRTLVICAHHEQYEHSCTDRFKLRANEEKALRLALTKVTPRQGRLIASAPGMATVMWHGLDGMNELVRTDAEGRFTYKRPHAAGEIVTISSDHFFYAFVQPHLEEGETFEIRVPAARARSFEVQLAKTSNDEMGVFTIALGDLVVPHQGFAQHLMRRKRQVSLKPGSSIAVPDVLETAPISVIYVPAMFLRMRPKEWSMAPEARSLPRRALGEQNVVMVE